MGPAGGVRFADILTTASAVANYLGEGDVRAAHVESAIALLLEETTMEALGRPVSPLVRRPAQPGATPQVRELVQRWFAVAGTPDALLSAEDIVTMRAELAAIDD